MESGSLKSVGAHRAAVRRSPGAAVYPVLRPFVTIYPERSGRRIISKTAPIAGAVRLCERVTSLGGYFGRRRPGFSAVGRASRCRVGPSSLRRRAVWGADSVLTQLRLVTGTA